MADIKQIKQLAQQGNPKAIAAILNQSLKKKGLEADVSRSGALLHIELTGQTPPDCTWAQRLEVGLKRLGIDNIQHVQLQAFTTENQDVVWQHDIILQPATSLVSTTTSHKSTPLITQVNQNTKAVNQPTVPDSQQSGKSQGNPALAPWINGALCVIAIAIALIAAINMSLLTNELLQYLFGRRAAASVVGRKAFGIFLSSAYNTYPVEHLKYFLIQSAMNSALLGAV
ncbi:MAG: hypothetical protein AAGF24_03040, partial [Cyanobacteria bacterium P01_H01_bin.121]